MKSCLYIQNSASANVCVLSPETAPRDTFSFAQIEALLPSQKSRDVQSLGGIESGCMFINYEQEKSTFYQSAYVYDHT